MGPYGYHYIPEYKYKYHYQYEIEYLLNLNFQFFAVDATSVFFPI